MNLPTNLARMIDTARIAVAGDRDSIRVVRHLAIRAGYVPRVGGWIYRDGTTVAHGWRNFAACAVADNGMIERLLLAAQAEIDRGAQPTPSDHAHAVMGAIVAALDANEQIEPAPDPEMVAAGQRYLAEEAIAATDREALIGGAMLMTGESRETVTDLLDALDCVADEERIEAEADATDYTHVFVNATGYCARYVEYPDGRERPCGEPVKSAIHDPQAYAAYHAEVTEALAEWTGKLKIKLSPGVTKRDGVVVGDIELTQLLLMLDHGVKITRNLYQDWQVDRSAALATAIDPVALDRTIRAALDVGLVAYTSRNLGDRRVYTLHAAPIHLARTDSETWCGRRILRAGHDRIRYATGSVEGPTHTRCVQRAADRCKQAGH